jgi:hypothetical protein
VLSVAKILRMPNTETLHKGARREFVEEFFLHYREAGRPTVRTVADWIRDNDSLSGTASAETVRRVLAGLTVSRNWATVEAILYAFCALGPGPTQPRACAGHSGDIATKPPPAAATTNAATPPPAHRSQVPLAY